MAQTDKVEVQMVWKVVVVIFVILFIFFLTVGCIDGNRFVVVEENVYLDKLNKDCKFVLLSDFHNKVYGKQNEKVLEKIREINPDFIVIAGDMVTSHVNEDDAPAIELIQALQQDYKIYYGLGNHETKVRTGIKDFGNKYDEYMQKIASNNVKVLRNESIILDEYNIKMTGLELEKYYYSKFKKRELKGEVLVEKIGDNQEEYCNFLIAHHPDYFEEYAEWGADFVLSGHVHGGIMRLPILGGVISPSYELFPKYDGGLFSYQGKQMLLGRGMGAHTIPLRFFNPAELYVVNCLHK